MITTPTFSVIRSRCREVGLLGRLVKVAAIYAVAMVLGLPAADHRRDYDLGEIVPGSEITAHANPPGRVISGAVQDAGGYMWDNIDESFVNFGTLVPYDASGTHEAQFGGEYVYDGDGDEAGRVFTWILDATGVVCELLSIEPGLVGIIPDAFFCRSFTVTNTTNEYEHIEWSAADGAEIVEIEDGGRVAKVLFKSADLQESPAANPLAWIIINPYSARRQVTAAGCESSKHAAVIQFYNVGMEMILPSPINVYLPENFNNKRGRQVRAWSDIDGYTAEWHGADDTEGHLAWVTGEINETKVIHWSAHVEGDCGEGGLAGVSPKRTFEFKKQLELETNADDVYMMFPGNIIYYRETQAGLTLSLSSTVSHKTREQTSGERQYSTHTTTEGQVTISGSIESSWGVAKVTGSVTGSVKHAVETGAVESSGWEIEEERTVTIEVEETGIIIPPNHRLIVYSAPVVRRISGTFVYYEDSMNNGSADARHEGEWELEQMVTAGRRDNLEPLPNVENNGS